MTSSDTDLDIALLAADVREGPTGLKIARLWRAVFGLDSWWLLPTGDPADPRPMIGVVEEQAFLLAFTSEINVKQFADSHSDVSDDSEGIAAMAITPAAMTDLAPRLIQQEIAGLLFNQGPASFVAPVAGLAALYGQFSGGPGATDPR